MGPQDTESPELDTSPPRRFVIVGAPASGKTTLARRLSVLLGIPHLSPDEVRVDANGTRRDRSAVRALLAPELAKDRWVLDSDTVAVWDIAWPRAHTVAVLDYPLPLILWRYLRRAVILASHRPPPWAHTRSRMRLFATQVALVRQVLAVHRKYRRLLRAEEERERLAGVDLLPLRSPREAQAWLASLGAHDRDPT